MKILVTGGAGFIGGHLVDTLIARGDEVHVCDNYSLGSYVNPHAQNFREEVGFFSISRLTKFDVIFHLAARSRIKPSFEAPVPTIMTNVVDTACVLELARKTGAKFVYAGSSSVYHDPYANPYAWSKWVGEEACKLYQTVWGVPCGIARFFNVYGPRQPSAGDSAIMMGIFERLKGAGLPLTVSGDGEQRRDFIHVSDVVAGLIRISELDLKSEIYNLGTGKNYSINEVANLFEPVGIEYIPAGSGEARNTLADISVMQSLGWEPKVSLESYIQCLRDGAG